MSTIAQDSLRALQAFAERHRKRGLLTNLLQPFFNRLSLATRLHLAQDAMTTMCVATIEAEKRWGDVGGVVIRNSTVLVGVREDGKLKVLGSGVTAREAFAQVDKAAPPPEAP